MKRIVFLILIAICSFSMLVLAIINIRETSRCRIAIMQLEAENREQNAILELLVWDSPNLTFSKGDE